MRLLAYIQPAGIPGCSSSGPGTRRPQDICTCCCLCSESHMASSHPLGLSPRAFLDHLLVMTRPAVGNSQRADGCCRLSGEREIETERQRQGSEKWPCRQDSAPGALTVVQPAFSSHAQARLQENTAATSYSRAFQPRRSKRT